MNSLKLLIADDESPARSRLRQLLEEIDGWEAVAEAQNGHEVIDICNRIQPDVVLLDIRMPNMDGLEVLDAMMEQGVSLPTLILTTFDEHELVLKCMKLGAKGYLRKDVSLDALMKAIEAVVAGELWIQPAITNHVIENHKKISENFLKTNQNDLIHNFHNVNPKRF